MEVLSLLNLAQSSKKHAASGRVIQAGCQLWVVKSIGSFTRPWSGWPLPFTVHCPRGIVWCRTPRKAEIIQGRSFSGGTASGPRWREASEKEPLVHVIALLSTPKQRRTKNQEHGAMQYLSWLSVKSKIATEEHLKHSVDLLSVAGCVEKCWCLFSLGSSFSSRGHQARQPRFPPKEKNV